MNPRAKARGENLTDYLMSLGALPSKLAGPLFRRCPSGKERVCTSGSTTGVPKEAWFGWLNAQRENEVWACFHRGVCYLGPRDDATALGQL